MVDQEKNSKFDTAINQIRELTGYALKLAIVILFAVAAWRMAWSSISLDLSKFEFSDLLATILALFAVGMSVAFYFKTTDSSNQFYDNIYNFTQKTSEILGRIEERFGERLKHLDEGQGRIQSQFDGISKSPRELEIEVKETEDREEEVQENLQAVLAERESLIRELSERAYKQDREQQDFIQKMKNIEQQRDEAESNIRELKKDRDQLLMQLHDVERDTLEDFADPPTSLTNCLMHIPELLNLAIKELPLVVLQSKSRHLISKLPKEITTQLQKAGIVSMRGEISPYGARALRNRAAHLHIK